MERRYSDEKRSLLSADMSDVRLICQTGAVLGSVLLIIGLLMLLPVDAITSSRMTASIAFMAAGALLLTAGVLLLRRTRHETAEAEAADSKAEWRRFVIAAAAYAAISLVLTMLNIRLELALGLPLAILSMYLFWLHVLQKRNESTKSK